MILNYATHTYKCIYVVLCFTLHNLKTTDSLKYKISTWISFMIININNL